MLTFLRNWTLPLAMLIGALGYPLLMHLSIFTPLLIFMMLLLTFCKISPRDLKPTLLHVWLLLIQIVGALAVYFLFYRYNKIVAEGALVCVICPTATAAAVVTSKLGGNAASLTTYTLLANMGAAIAVPILFPLIESHPEIAFCDSAFKILQKVFLLLICPFMLAWLLEKKFKKTHAFFLRHHGMAFYLWAISLTIVTAQTVFSLINHTEGGDVKIIIALVALLVCVLQFFIGKQIGGLYNERISGGQALGQKNTILAIWMAYTYLDPLSAVAPGAYVLWQNIINSWQLWKKRKK